MQYNFFCLFALGLQMRMIISQIRFCQNLITPFRFSCPIISLILLAQSTILHNVARNIKITDASKESEFKMLTKFAVR